jgi:putative DNA primase/helicase
MESENLPDIDVPDDWEDNYSAAENHIPPAAQPVARQAEGIVPLGYDHTTFYYFSRSAQQVFALPADKHSKNHMLAMASLPHYWEQTRFFREKGGINWDAAIDNLMAACRDVGVYDPDRIRGRGAWLDNSRSLLHLGDRILMDGQDIGLAIPDSRFVYECARPLSVVDAPPLPTVEANCLAKLCSQLRWERPVYAKLFAGWLALAPICGALNWRPSIWVTGSAGSGKSWIRERIMAATLGNIALAVQSKTSEAGIRQSLGSDARPVLFDEAEREDAQAAQRMQAVLDLVRQSSSEGGAEIVKGTGNQSGAKRYRIRSMFAFQSINVALLHQADESRVTVLSLREPVKGDPLEQAKFADLEIAVAERLTPEFSAGLVARAVALIPVIRANAETFARAIASGHGTRRLGDQVGTLLAGAYSLHSQGLISAEDAAAFVAREEWADHTDTEEEKDENRLLRTILAHRVRVGTVEMPVARLIEAAQHISAPEGLPAPELAERVLNEIGVKFAYRENLPGIYVSNSHQSLRNALRGTPWDASWSRALKRIEGVVPAEKVIHFGLANKTRGVWVPMTVLNSKEDSL